MNEHLNNESEFEVDSYELGLVDLELELMSVGEMPWGTLGSFSSAGSLACAGSTGSSFSSSSSLSSAG